MPFYDFKCEKCGEKKEEFMKMADYHRPICCGSQMQRLYNYHVVRDLQPYLDENISHDAQWVKSKKHRKQLMKENGVSEKFGKGWF